MDNNTALSELFSKTINALADAEIAELERAAEEKSAASGKEKSERAARDAIADIRAEENRLRFRFKKDISKCDYDMKKSVLAHRNELIEGFFADIEKETLDFGSSPEYKDYLKKALERALSELGGSSGAEICVRSCDVDLMKALTELPVAADSAIKLGGLCARRAGLFADCTLDKALADEKAAFSDKTELRL